MSRDISAKQKLAFLKQMIYIRTFEEKVKVLLAEGLIRGAVHLYIGEEAVAVGICSALKKEDWVVSTHRGHGHCIAKGTDVFPMFAELLGKEAGCCKGKGGSMHIADVSKGILGASGIVGSGIPIAVGAALSSKYLKQDKVVVSFFGDGASNTGTFHECLNLGSLWKLPVVFVCENNLYAITVPAERSTSVRDIADRAVSYSMPGEVVDGSDVLAVFQAGRKAVKQARHGEGPTLIECKTYRYEGHWVGDPICYRTKEEEEFWRENRDPIAILKQTLDREGILTENIYQRFVEDSRGEIDQAVEWAKSQPSPAPEQATCDIYSD